MNIYNLKRGFMTIQKPFTGFHYCLMLNNKQSVGDVSTCAAHKLKAFVIGSTEQF